MICPFCPDELPHCHATAAVKNGIRPLTGRQQCRCQDCQRQFVANPKNPRVPPWQKTMIGRLLPERIPLAGIARVAGVSGRWLAFAKKLENHIGAIWLFAHHDNSSRLDFS